MICKLKPSVLWLNLVFCLLAASILLLTAKAEGGQDNRSVKTPVSNTFLKSLTEKEQVWLHDHPVIRTVQDPGWPPIEFTDLHGEPSGMAGDYLSLIEQRLGVKFERIRNLSWQEAYARLKSWEIDMTTSVAVTPERAKFWAFTKPYMKIPIVIVAHSDVTYIADMRELAGKKVAVVDGYAVNYWIPRDFPEIRLVRVKTAQEGFKALQRGEVFAYIENMLVVGYYMAKLKMTTLKIAGETPYANNQCMAVRKDWVILAGILQKALDSITESERNGIYRKWLPIRYEHGFNYTLLWKALAVFAMVLLALVFWIRKLAREIKYRKNAEAASNENALRFSRLFEVAAMPLCLIDKDGVLMNLNEYFVHTFGYNKEDVPTFAEWWRLAYPDPDYRRWVIDTWETAIKRAAENNTNIEPIEYNITCKNGEVRTIIISGTLIGENFLATFFDITEHKRAEKKLLKSEEKFRTIFDMASDGILIVDPISKKFLQGNTAICSMLGYTEEEIESLTIYNIHPQEDISHVLDEFDKQLKGEKVFAEDLPVLRKDGAIFYADIGAAHITIGGTLHLMGIFHDITERKRAEEEALRTAREWQTTFDASNDAIWILDREQRVLRSNKTAEQFFHLPCMDLIGKHCWEIVHGTSQPIPDCPLLLSRKSLQRETMELRIDEGWFQVIVDPILDAAGNYAGAVHIVSNITERKRMEEELLKAHKLESVGILAGGIAHDFNNILTSISGNISMAKILIKPGHKIFDLLSAAEKASVRAQGLTRQLLTFAKGGAPIKETASIQKLIEESSIFVLQGSKSVCEFKIAEDLWPVEADVGQISQVISNIIINANQAMPDGGIIRITAENLTPDKIYEIPVKPGRYICISIKDQGGGIAEKNISKIFDPYFTTKQAGSGLGLATAYSIIKKHNGHISVDSIPGTGTTFDIYLPASDKEVPAKEEAVLLTGRGKILMMDDDELLKEIAEDMLDMLGYESEFAKNGTETIEMYEKAVKSEKPYDAVFLDLTIPGGMGGKEVIEILQKMDPEVKAIVLSGYSDGEIMSNFLEYGFKGMMAKPFDVYALGKVLNDVLKG